MRIDAALRKKEDQIRAVECCEIIKTIELPHAEYHDFCRNLMKPQDFIAENAQMMSVENYVYSCLLVLGEGHDDGILVHSSGYDYARYTAHVPNARQLLAEQQRYNCVRNLENSLATAATALTAAAGAYSGEGSYYVSINGVAEEYGFDNAYAPLLVSMIRERGEVQADLVEDNIAIFCPTLFASGATRHEVKILHHAPMRAAERLFADRMAEIEGVDLTKLTEWYAHTWAKTVNFSAESGIPEETIYPALLMEYANAFAKVDRAYEECAAEIFNYEAAYRPDQLFKIAEWICEGGSAKDAYEIWGKPRSPEINSPSDEDENPGMNMV